MSSEDGPPSTKKARAATVDDDRYLRLQEGMAYWYVWSARYNCDVLFEVRTCGPRRFRTAQRTRNWWFVIFYVFVLHILNFFKLLAGYGKVFLVRKIRGKDAQKLYAMKVLNKSAVVRKRKVMEHTLTERSVLQEIRDFPFLVTLHYAFQTDAKLHLVMGKLLYRYYPCI